MTCFGHEASTEPLRATTSKFSSQNVLHACASSFNPCLIATLIRVNHRPQRRGRRGEERGDQSLAERVITVSTFDQVKKGRTNLKTASIVIVDPVANRKGKNGVNARVDASHRVLIEDLTLRKHGNHLLLLRKLRNGID